MTNSTVTDQPRTAGEFAHDQARESAFCAGYDDWALGRAWTLHRYEGTDLIADYVAGVEAAQRDQHEGKAFSAALALVCENGTGLPLPVASERVDLPPPFSEPVSVVPPVDERWRAQYAETLAVLESVPPRWNAAELVLVPMGRRYQAKHRRIAA